MSYKYAKEDQEKMIQRIIDGILASKAYFLIIVKDDDSMSFVASHKDETQYEMMYEIVKEVATQIADHTSNVMQKVVDKMHKEGYLFFSPSNEQKYKNNVNDLSNN